MSADQFPSERLSQINAWRALLKPVEREALVFVMQRKRTTWSIATALVAAGLWFGPTIGSSIAHDASGMWEFLRSEANRSAQQRSFPGLIAEREDAPTPSHPHHQHVRLAAAETGPVLEQRGVCVRLCDGYFFPMGDVHGPLSVASQEASCSRMCPGAATRLYVLPAGTDQIEQASTKDGQLYSTLPAAFRNRHTADDACSCQPANERQLTALMKDLTLRPGDAVATSTGVRVFKGAAHWPFSNKDFLSLVEARSMRLSSSALTAVEKAIKQPLQLQARFSSSLTATPEAPPTPGMWESAKDQAGKPVRVINIDRTAL
jgi:hypothetical protein